MIEITVIIGIIFILMAIMVPSLGKYRKTARTAQGMNNLGQIVTTATNYAVDHNNTYPLGYDRDTQSNGSIGEDETDWIFILNDYMTGKGDTYAKLNPDPPNQDQIYLPLQVFRDPNAAFPDIGLYHYSCHPILMPDSTTTSSNPNDAGDWPNWKAYRMSWVRRPSEVILIMDGVQDEKTQGDNETDEMYTLRIRTPYATARSIDGGAMNPWQASFGGGDPREWMLSKAFYSSDADDNGAAIDPGDNTDTTENSGDIRWRQGTGGDTPNTWAGNFVFPDGHAATLKPSEVLKRNVRIDNGYGWNQEFPPP